MAFKGQKMEPFDLSRGEGTELEVLADEIYGASAPDLDTGRIVAHPIDLREIWADVAQPRRAVPVTIGLHRTGDPLEVAPLLQAWQTAAEMAAETTIDVPALLRGEGEGLTTDNWTSVTQDFIDLVRLAQDIAAVGLTNPITVINADGHHLIETGERRWLAFHLLALHMGDQWQRIPAQISDGRDFVWRQATENTKRRSLNAIGMARQLALLIMAARDKIGQGYADYSELVKEGTCDRRYYAQVADGQVHRLPRGMGERIQSAMGLGMEQLSQYRRLLKLFDDEQVNDVLWVRADAENWPENALREIATLTAVKVSEVTKGSDWTIGDLRALIQRPEGPGHYVSSAPGRPVRGVPAVQPGNPLPQDWMGKRVQSDTGLSGKVMGVSGRWITFQQDGGGQRSLDFAKMTIIGDGVATPAPARVDLPELKVGDAVRTRTGSIGKVVHVNGRAILVDDQNGQRMHNRDDLVKVERAPEPQASEPQPLPEAQPGDTVWLTDIEAVGKFLRYERGADGLTWAVVEVDGIHRLVAPLAIKMTVPVQPDNPLENMPTEAAAASDNGDSAVLLVKPFSTDHVMLMTLEGLAARMKHEEAHEAFTWLLNVTEEDVRQMENAPRDMTRLYNDMQAFLRWLLDEQINPVLQRIEQIAAQR